MFLLLWLSLLLYIGSGNAQTVVSCDQQLFNYYLGLGTQYTINETTPLLNPINLSFLPSPETGVQIEFLFGSIARLYESLTPGLAGTPPVPVINYVSFDLPFCATGINLVCGTALFRSLPKNALCDIVDYDVLGPNYAGRVFIYNDATTIQPGCNGNIVVQLFGNIDIQVNDNDLTTTYTYSYPGLIPDAATVESNLTLQEALAEYQNSLCVFTDGTEMPPVRPGQDQFVCRGNQVEQLICLAPRESRVTDPLLPVPSYACRGVGPNGEPNGTNLVFFITVYGETNPDVSDIFYDVHFCESYDQVCISQLNISFDETTPSGTRAQYISPFSDFTSGLVLDYQLNGFGVTESFTRPVYPFAVTDPFIRDIPCLCNLSMDCDENGNIIIGPQSKTLNPNNAIPIANATSNIFILPGLQTITLDASASFDPDNLPNPLSFFWKVYNSTPSPVTIDNPRSPIINVTADFVLGLYRFIVYVSDGQIVVYDLVNISVQLNVIRVILPNDFDVQWRLISVCPPGCPNGCELPPISQAIILNGSASFGENPSIPLFYEWTQVTGNNITVPFQCNPATVDYRNMEAFFNRNESIAYFIPASYGIYTFCLNVSDGGVSPSRSQCIHISVELNFERPNSTDRNYTDYPDAPIYNFSNGSVPTISFPPISPAPVNDITRSPSINDPVPTRVPAPLPAPPSLNATLPPINIIPGTTSILFPRLREPTAVEYALLLLAFIAMILGWILLFGTCIIFLPQDYENTRYDRVETNT